jgi:hypothetical protein
MMHPATAWMESMISLAAPLTASAAQAIAASTASTVQSMSTGGFGVDMTSVNRIGQDSLELFSLGWLGTDPSSGFDDKDTLPMHIVSHEYESTPVSGQPLITDSEVTRLDIRMR